MRNTNYFSALHGLRGILSLWVMSLHLLLFFSLGLKTDVQTIFWPFLTKSIWSGYLAVDAFFILSGFVIFHVYSNRYSTSSVADFLWARLARLYPVHIFVLFAYAALVWGSNLPFNHACFPHDPNSECDVFRLEAFLKNIFLVNAWGWFPRTSWNVNAWSISSESAAYIFTPVLIPLLMRIKNGYRALFIAVSLMGFLILGLPLAEKGQYFHQLFIGLLEKTNNHVGAQLFASTGPGILEFGFLRAFAGFLCGCCLYRFYCSPHFMKIPWHIVSLLSFAAVLMVIQYLPLYWAYIALIPLILSLAQAKGVIAKGLGTKPMQWLGDISYSLYMTHGVMLKLFLVILPIPMLTSLNVSEKGLLLIAIVSVLIAVSAGVFYCVEEPSRRFLKSQELCRLKRCMHSLFIPLWLKSISLRFNDREASLRE